MKKLHHQGINNPIIFNGRIWMTPIMASNNTINKHDCVLWLKVEQVFLSGNISYGFN